MSKKNHPGVYVPPPLLYVFIFFGAIWLQKLWPIDRAALEATWTKIAGYLLLGLFFIINVLAIRQFIMSKNTIIPIKPATSLQTCGIYAFTRNPMYLGLLMLYSGVGVFFGNWWTFILLPFLIAIIQWYVIRKEEQYLLKAFGEAYEVYKKRVRRWI